MQDESLETHMSDSVKLGIIIHRMGALETGMTNMGDKIDNMGSMYPTMMHVDLLLNPLREKVASLEEDKKEKEREDDRKGAQLKLAIVIALFSPIVSLMLSLLLESKK